MPSKVSRPLGFEPSTSGNLVPSFATDSAETYAQFPMSIFFETGPLCWAQVPEAPNSVKPTKAASILRIDLFMASPLSEPGTVRVHRVARTTRWEESLYPLPHPRHESLHSPHHAREVAAFHHLHHFLHLLELIQEPIHFLHRHARARGDTPFARRLEDLRPHPLSGSHGVDDAFDAAQLLFVHLRGLQALSELCGQLVDQSRYPAHLAHLA